MVHAPHTAGAAACVVTHAMVACRLSEIEALRSGGWPAGSPALPARFLRHSDEQTVVSMHAVLAAIARLPEPRPSFDRYGVITAPCQAGRISAAQTLVQAAAIGGAAVSTRIVPECSLHSPAGAVSVGLGMHGPNIGVGGGPEAVSEGLFTAVSWLRPTGPAICDGVWLLVSGWDEEPALDAAGKPTTDPICRAVAIALTPPCAGRLALHVQVDAARNHDERSDAASAAALLTGLGRALAAADEAGGVIAWSHGCPWAADFRLVAASVASPREAA